MPASGRDVDGARPQDLAVLALLAAESSPLLQAARELGGEQGRHVLDDEDGHGKIGRKGGNQLEKGGWTAR